VGRMQEVQGVSEISDQTIAALLEEHRVVAPSKEFVKNAVASSEDIYAKADADYEGFWAGEAEKLTWTKKWDTVLEWKAPWVKWFIGGKLNVSANCLDRHLDTIGDRVAFYFEGEPGDKRAITYKGLYEEVCQFANALKKMGVKKGDRVNIYMPMIPELPVAMLACARIGAPHSIVFGGFSAQALADRIQDASAKILITADGGWRRGSVVPLKQAADEAVAACPTIEKVVVVKRIGKEIPWNDKLDVWYHDVVKDEAKSCPAEEMDAEDPLFILYTSGTTGKPKGILHTTGGYLTGVASTHMNIFDIHPETDVFWCTADIGWVTGHSYIVYGPLANGTTGILYEGSPDFPDKDRFWSIIEEYKATILYTAPTAIRTFMKWGKEYPDKHDLSSLRLLGSVGEPINPEAWMWYWEVIGGERCPIVDTWWQTETGGILITPLPGIVDLKPGSATRPYPGVFADIVDDKGNSVPLGGGGYLVLRRPWPAQLRTIFGDDERYVETYFSRFGPEVYFTGDGAKRDAEGYYWLLGRVDDVMNVAGHRLSTYEIESALVDHPAVAEAAVVSRPDPVSGETPVAFISLRAGFTGDEALIKEIRAHVGTKIGKIARPSSIILSADLPKTRSGKIMRRLLRDIAREKQMGDVTTLANAEIMEEIKRMAAAKPSED